MADPKIKYDIEADVKGDASVEALEQHLRQLGQVLDGDLKKQATAAADALKNLGAKQETLATFRQLGNESKALAVELAQADGAVSRLAQELPQAAAATSRFAAAEAAARTAVEGAKRDLDSQRQALVTLREEFTGAARRTDAYREANAQLQVTVSSLRTHLKEQQQALQAATGQAATAAAAEKKLGTEYSAAADSANKMRGAVLENSRALDAAKSSLAGFGIGTNNLAESERNLGTAIGQVRERVQGLAPAFAQSASAISAGATKSAASIRGITEESNKAEKSGTSLGEVFGKLGPIMAAAFSGRQMLDAIVQAEGLKRGFTAVTGSSSAAAAEMEYLRTTSNRLGLELQGTSQAYLSLSAATKGTAIEGQKTKDLFEALSRAGTTLGKSGEEIGRMLTAVSQMASKGTVSMEELRGQLGEALPGAMAAAAKGAGLTTQELIQMVSQGDVLASDLLPALTKGLNELYSAAPPGGVISDWNRFKNVITETSVALGEGGGSASMSWLLGKMAGALVGFKETAVLGAEGVGQLAGAIATAGTGSFTMGEKLNAAADRINRVKESAAGAAPDVKNLGTAAAATGEAAQEAFRKAEIAAQNAGDGMQQSVLKQKAAFAELEKAAERRLDQAKKAAEAADGEAKTITAIAAAFGTETDKMAANTLAATLQRDAQLKLAEARRAELAIIEQKLAALVKETQGMQKVPPEIEEQRKKLEGLISVKKEEVRATDASAKSQEVAAVAARTAAEAYKDNSGRLYELKAAYDNATRAVEELRVKQTQGKASAEEVNAAVLKQAAAQKLYADALRDTVTAAEIHEKVIARNAVTRAKESELNIEAARTTLELAKTRGDEAAATAAQTRLANEEREARRQAVQAVRDEANAMRATADALEREAKATGALTTEKKEQIAAIRASAEQKDLDARKSEMLAEREYQLALATASSADAFVIALEKKVAAQEKYNAVIERADALERKRLNIDKDGFSTDKDGKRIAAGSDLGTLTGIAAFLKTAGVADDATARDIAREFADSQGNVQYMDNPGQRKYGGDTISMALLKAAERYTFGIGGAGLPAAGSQPATIPAQTHAVTINIAGRSLGPINTDQAGQSTLEELVRQLEDSKRASGR